VSGRRARPVGAALLLAALSAAGCGKDDAAADTQGPPGAGPDEGCGVSQYADLSEEWISVVSPLDETPSYGETPPSEIGCGTRSQEHSAILQATNTGHYDYWSTFHAFAFVLDLNYDGQSNPVEEDFLTNVDTASLLCTIGDSVWHACGFDVDDLGAVVATSAEWGGTTVTYERLMFLEGNPRGLVWRYSANDPGNIFETPWLHGRDSEEEDYAELNELISFGLHTYEDGLTATTTAFALVEHMILDPALDNEDLGNWCHLYSEQADPMGAGLSEADPDGDYVYWYGMAGVTRSIFAACPEGDTGADSGG